MQAQLCPFIFVSLQRCPVNAEWGMKCLWDWAVKDMGGIRDKDTQGRRVQPSSVSKILQVSVVISSPLESGTVGGLRLEQRGDPGAGRPQGISLANPRLRLGYDHSRCDALWIWVGSWNRKGKGGRSCWSLDVAQFPPLCDRLGDPQGLERWSLMSSCPSQAQQAASALLSAFPFTVLSFSLPSAFLSRQPASLPPSLLGCPGIKSPKMPVPISAKDFLKQILPFLPTPTSTSTQDECTSGLLLSLPKPEEASGLSFIHCL